MNAMDKTSETRDKLMSDLRTVIRDTEELLSHTGQHAGEGFAVAKAKLEASLKTAKEEFIRVEETVIAKTKEVAVSTDEYVHKHPWQAVGISAAVGVLLGMLIRK